MITAAVRISQWTGLPVFKNATSGTRASVSSSNAMANLKRGRESPLLKTSSSIITPASATPENINRDSVPTSLEEPLHTQSTEQTYWRPAKRAKIIMSQQHQQFPGGSDAQDFPPFLTSATAAYPDTSMEAAVTTAYVDGSLEAAVYTTATTPAMYANYARTASASPMPYASVSPAEGPGYYPAFPSTFPQADVYASNASVDFHDGGNVKEIQKEKRREQNREAQRKFRTNRKKNLHDLESRVTTLERDLDDANAELEQIKQENLRLRQEIHAMQSSAGVSYSHSYRKGHS